jgi:hypothetical protein
MILLILGWHLSLAGLIALIIGVILYSTSCLIFGVGMIVPGLILSVALRKSCSSYHSDVKNKSVVEAPLDYY